jgi:adenylate cyclase
MDGKRKVKPKILMVDDEPDNLDLLYRTFRHEYRVLRAPSGPEALDLLAQEPEVAVIISDQRMPHMSGTEFLSLTASQYPDIIRIILTGYTDVDDLVEAINSGQVFKYVTKPWDEEELRGVVQQAVETHKILKARTLDLRRSLRQESLLNAISSTLRSALDYRQLLQTLVQTVGDMFEVDLCLIKLLHQEQLSGACFVHQLPTFESSSTTLALGDLGQTVWETETVQVLEDTTTAPVLQAMVDQGQALNNLYQRLGICSTLIIPMVYQQKVLAVLALHHCQQKRPWPEADVHLLELVADQAAPAVSQALAYEQLRSLAQRQGLVNTITNAIRSSLDPQDIFAAITQQLGEALQVDSCALSLWTAEDEYVHCVGLYARDGQAKSELSVDIALSGNLAPTGTELPQSYSPIQGNPVLTQLLQTQQPVVLEDLASHPEAMAQKLSVQPPSQSLLVVPLLADDRLIGSISLRQVSYARQWQPPEVELAQIVAAQAAIAVQQSRLYETTRQQAEQLLELDRQKTEFFQNISHEFRTPLTLTIGPLEAAVAKTQGLSLDQSLIALRSSRRLLRLVNQLLDLQRLDADRMQPHFRPVEIQDFLAQIIESFRPYCEKKGLNLITHLTDTSTLYLDPEKFDKVIYNLLSNAMKFTPKGGTIQVRLVTQGEHCQVQVQDSGIGIRADQLPYLFERFRQAEGSASRSYEGSGLGLALVKRLVELHGGQVQVESVYGKGSTFKLDLPLGKAHLPPEWITDAQVSLEAGRASVELADVEAEVVEAETDEKRTREAEEENSEQPLILVVDDNIDLRTYLSQILRNEGYRICSARQGAEGFELAQKYHPDLIVTDLMMPVVSGLDLIHKIRGMEKLRGTPVVLLTAKADEDTRITSAEQGADAYLSKPFNDRELLAEVRNLLALKSNERRVEELNLYLTETVLGRFLPPAMVKRQQQEN